MISLPRIVRLAAAHRFDTLMDDVLRNGRALPLGMQLRLGSEVDALPGASLGLALQRFLELTLGPTPQAIDLARALLDRQRPGGSFGSIGATAAALAGLAMLEETLGAIPGAASGVEGAGDALRGRIGEAIDRGVEFLRDARENAPSTLIAGRALLGDELDTLIALWQLAGHARLADALDLPSLMASLEDIGMRHDRAFGPVLDRVEAALAPVDAVRSTRAA